MTEEQLNAIESQLNQHHAIDFDVIEALIDAVRRQRRIIETLRSALESYADGRNWVNIDDGSPLDDVWLGAGGGRDAAREALAAVAAMEDQG